MSHRVSRQGWGVVDLNMETGHVFVQQRWRYNWLLEAGARRWTYGERRGFHHTVDRQIWRVWSDRLRVVVTGDHDLARSHPSLRLTFDVMWVLRDGNWTVNVTKMRPGSPSPRSWVDFGGRTIHLDTLDTVPHPVGNDAGVSRPGFLTAPHEFGHTFPERGGGASPVLDEYRAGGAHLGDTDSLMNIGTALRSRHVTAVVAELAALVPECTFTATH